MMCPTTPGQWWRESSWRDQTASCSGVVRKAEFIAAANSSADSFENPKPAPCITSRSGGMSE